MSDSDHPEHALAAAGSDWLAHDLGLLRMAALFDLSDPAGRTASASWLRELYIQIVGILRPQLVLELGAAEASFSTRVRTLLQEAEFHAFEANPHVFELHRDRLREMGVDYHNLAVGRQSGRAMFKIAIERGGKPRSPARTNNSFLEKSPDFTYQAVEATVVAVDDFVRDRGLENRNCAAWIDVEGLAYEVLSGAQSTLAHVSALLVELEDKPFWQGQRLAPEVKELLFRAGLVPVARDFQQAGQYNVVFLNRKACADFAVRLALEQAFANTPRGRTGD